MKEELTDKDLLNKNKFKGMTKWFSPVVLLKTGVQAVVTTMFSQYADGRLIQATLDAEDQERLAERYDYRKQLKPDEDGAIWVDYVADLGDGFNSTYSVAYLLAQKNLSVEGLDRPLPRGQILVMGGDEVYPFPTRDEYKNRMQNTYKYAFPDSSNGDADHPNVFLIPGNHDWYDGLKLFQGLFCTGKPTKLGSWRTAQHRSYFSIRLAENWWLWGFDSGVDDTDIDVPQANYFHAVAESMTEKPNVIICASVPIWLKAGTQSGREEMEKGANYIANLVLRVRPGCQVYAAISGDTHHYNRYRAPKYPTQFLTAGGGGAFLHPTHQLEEKIPMPWMGHHLNLSLKTRAGPDYEEGDKEVCYPSKEDSRSLVLQNWKFPFVNFSFCMVIASLYWLVSTVTQATVRYDWHGRNFTNPFFIAGVGVLFLALRQYADSQKIVLKNGLAVGHTVLHGLFLLWLTVYLPPFNRGLVGHYWSFWLFALEMVPCGLFGGLLWGFYLIVASLMFGVHHNDAYSAMTRTEYRNFLRMRIKDDELTIYPIGVDKVPDRKGWKLNPDAATNNQNESLILPKKNLTPRLIEGPVIVTRSH